MGGMYYEMAEEEKLASKIILQEVNAPKLPEPKQAPEESDGEGEVDEPDGEAGKLDYNDDEREGPPR